MRKSVNNRRANRANRANRMNRDNRANRICRITRFHRSPGIPFASHALWSPRSPRFIVERMSGERYRRGPVCRQAGGGLQRSGFSVHIRCACTEPPRPPPLISSRYSEPKGRASRPRRAATRCDRRAAQRSQTAKTPRPPRLAANARKIKRVE